MNSRLMIAPLFWVQVEKSLTTDDTDIHGNVIRAYGSPIECKVYGWAAPTSNESNAIGESNRIVHDLELFAPEDFPATAFDRVTVDGVRYEMQGDPLDFNNGPFGFRPGLVVDLKKVTG